MDLYSALKSGSPQELLAFAKIDPNQDYSSWIHTHFDRNDGICEGSTLHVASASGSDALVEMLVNFGADPNVVDCDGDTPLHWACANDYPDVVRMLLQKGANVEVANDEGNTPFLEACSEGNVEVMKVLLEFGCQVGLRNDEGLGAFDLLYESENTSAIGFFKDWAEQNNILVEVDRSEDEERYEAEIVDENENLEG